MKFKNVNQKIKKYWMFRRAIFLLVLLLQLISIICINVNNDGVKISGIIVLSMLITLQSIYTFYAPSKEYPNYTHLVKEYEIIVMKGWYRKESYVISKAKITKVMVSNKGMIKMFKLVNIVIYLENTKFIIKGLENEDANKIQFILGFNEKGERI